MLMKNCMATPAMAAHRNVSPAFEAMNGNRMYSPEATPTPTRITLGPISRRRRSGSGRSRTMDSSRGAAGGSSVMVPGVLMRVLLSPPV
jgi:hypothetical protein